MQTQVEALYQMARKKYKLEVHGGQKGMSKSASWVYLAEDIQNVTFLKGGELIITTGLFTQRGVTLYDFIQTLVLSNCCGILINIGNYLNVEDITPDIVEFCNSNKFPIFTMPWEIHLIDIMQDYCRLLLHDNRKEEHLSATFQNAVDQIPVRDNILRNLNQFGFVTQAEYLVIVIHNLDDPYRVSSSLNVYGLKYHLFQHDNLQVLIYDTVQKQISLDKIIEITCFCDSIMAGVSDTAHSLAEIGEYYRRARFALAAAEFWKRPCIRFDELGLFQVLYCTSDLVLLETIYKKHLGELEEYDQSHNSDYMNTLRMFLLSDCNLQDAASRLFLHRNTIVYRIQKIKEILHTGLDNSAIKFDLLVAFYIKEYLSI